MTFPLAPSYASSSRETRPSLFPCTGSAAVPFSEIAQISQGIFAHSPTLRTPPSAPVPILQPGEQIVSIKGIEYILARSYDPHGQHLPHEDKLFTGKTHRLFYTGEMLNGVPHGRGKFTNLNGICIGIFSVEEQQRFRFNARRINSIYEGQFSNGLAHGHGVLRFAGGNKFEGEFKNGVEDGYGEESSQRKILFKGYYRNGLRHGHGVYTAAEDYSFEGDYCNGLWHGYGEVLKKDGSKESGKFVCGILPPSK